MRTKPLAVSALILLGSLSFSQADELLGRAYGMEDSVPPEVRTYVMEHPVRPLSTQLPLSDDYAFGSDVELFPVPGYPEYGYVYADGRPVIVQLQTRRLVYAPAPLATGSTASIRGEIPQEAIMYIEGHPLDPVMLEGPVEMGTVIPEDLQVVVVPDEPDYGYIYVDQQPVLVQMSTRRVVWVR